MADFSALKTAIQTYIKQNGNEEITGEVLQTILLSVVTTLGDSAINDLITALNNEVAARQNADGSLEGAINQEGTLRSNADSTLQGNIDAEATARENADTALSNRLGSTITAENTAAEQIGAEAEAREEAEAALQGLIDGITENIENGYVYAGIATPSTTPVTGKVFYLALTAGTYTNFGNTPIMQGINIFKYNGSSWLHDAYIGISDKPIPSDTGLVKAGGTFDFVMDNGSAFDISKFFASGSTLATYENLDAALTDLDGLDAAYKRGGMSIKYVQSSDNKYVQYRFMLSTFTEAQFTNPTNWQSEFNTEAVNDDEEEILIQDDNGNTIHKITEDDANFKNLKSNNNSVLVGSDITVSSDETSGNDTLKVNDVSKGTFANGEKLIELKGLLSSNDNWGDVEIGDVAYNTSTKLLRKKIDSSTYETIPFYSGALYTFDGDLYIWNGSDLVRKTYNIDNKPTLASKNLLDSESIFKELNNYKLSSIVTTYSTGTGYPQITTKTIASNASYTYAVYGIGGEEYIGIKIYNTNIYTFGGAGILFTNDPTLSDLANARWVKYNERNTDGILTTEGYNYVVIPKSVVASGFNLGDVYNVSVENKYQEKLEGINKYISDEFEYSIKYGTGLTTSENADGFRNFELLVGAGKTTGAFLQIMYELQNSVKWINGHEYLLVIDALVNSDSHSLDGNTYITTLPCSAVNVYVGSSTNINGLVIGTRGYHRSVCTITSENANLLELRPNNVRYNNTDNLDIDVYGVAAIDLTANEMTADEAIAIINKYGIKSQYFIVDSVNHAHTADVASHVESIEIGKNIDIWGDSIVVQDWGQNLATITSRTVTSHGYGGMTSTFIRDRFLEGYNPNNTNIIFVGRNNFSIRPESVINDIRDMTSRLGSDFIVMLPWNGCYNQEFKPNNGRYKTLIELGEKLRDEYQDNFFDTRVAVIHGWDCGNVRLLSSFIQPAVGSSVQINVSDANFLNYNNSSDGEILIEKTGDDDVMQKIVIEFNGTKDVYKIISKDDSTHLTVSLVSHALFDVGETVDNKLDNTAPMPGYERSIDYLNVIKYSDWLLINEYDTTPSSFRRDAVHMETARDDKARTFLAKIVARKLNALKI